MPEYTVTFEIEVDEDSPDEAVDTVRKMICEEDIYSWHLRDNETGKEMIVDRLSKVDEED